MPTVLRRRPPRALLLALPKASARPVHHFPDCPGSRCDCRERGLRLLAALDLPDCACPLVWAWDEIKEAHALAPCSHVLAAWPHRLSAVEWAALAALLDPDHHTEPTALPQPAFVLTRAARVAIYTERANCCVCGRCVRNVADDGWEKRRCAGERLWCKRDLWRTQPTDDRIQTGPTAEHEPNGAPVVQQRLSARRPT